MGKPNFFVFYQDDEGHTIEWEKFSEEEALVKGIVKQYEASKKIPALVIRGEKLKIKISTQVLFELEERK